MAWNQAGRSLTSDILRSFGSAPPPGRMIRMRYAGQMDFDLPPEADPRRVEVRRWLTEHPTPSGRELAEAGYVVPHWPPPWGMDAEPELQLIIDDELRRA